MEPENNKKRESHEKQAAFAHDLVPTEALPWYCADAASPHGMWPYGELRPLVKALKEEGVEHLSLAQLVRIIAKGRCTDAAVYAAAEALSLERDVAVSALWSLPFGPQLVASLELGRRLWLSPVSPRGGRVQGPSDAVAFSLPLLRWLQGQRRPTLVTLSLDQRLRVAKATPVTPTQAWQCDGSDELYVPWLKMNPADVLAPTLSAQCKRCIIVAMLDTDAMPLDAGRLGIEQSGEIRRLDPYQEHASLRDAQNKAAQLGVEVEADLHAEEPPIDENDDMRLLAEATMDEEKATRAWWLKSVLRRWRGVASLRDQCAEAGVYVVDIILCFRDGHSSAVHEGVLDVVDRRYR